MKVVIARSIRRKEFRRGEIAPLDLHIILRSCAEGIFTVIKGEALPKGSRLVKIYATSVAGARRVVM